MGIVLNALVIAVGSLVGSWLHKGVSKENFRTLGIGIVIVSLVGFFENVYNIENGKLVSQSLVLVLRGIFYASDCYRGLRHRLYHFVLFGLQSGFQQQKQDQQRRPVAAISALLPSRARITALWSCPCEIPPKYRLPKGFGSRYLLPNADRGK